MKKFILIITTSFFLIFSHFSYALSITDAKNQGAIGETSSGYLASVSTAANPSILNLVKSINIKRKAAYTKKAAKAGVSVDTIATRVAQRLFEKASSGSFLKNPAGTWYKK